MRANRYLMCVSNEGYPASLEPAKFYRTLSDRKAVQVGLVRVIDESGEDYLYPAKLFKAFDLPPPLTRTLGRVLATRTKMPADEAA
jgi:hypothetical protein